MVNDIELESQMCINIQEKYNVTPIQRTSNKLPLDPHPLKKISKKYKTTPQKIFYTIEYYIALF